MQEEIIQEPPLYFAEEHIWDLAFHPHKDFLACTLINGVVEILKYSEDDVIVIQKLEDLHKDSVRTCSFNAQGTLLATGARDKRIGYINQHGQIAHTTRKAHKDPINKVQFIRNNLLASGDDEGIVKIWDYRFPDTSVFESEEQSQAITGFAFSERQNMLLSTSLDGTLAVYDLRKAGTVDENGENKSLYALSDCMEEDLLGVELIKSERYVACNSSEGVILLFKWDWFGNCKDRIQGHPSSIDAMIKLDQNTVITGSEDGFVRGVSIYPNKIAQVLGQHEEEENFPVQKLSLAHCGKILASCSHDSSIKFYDVAEFAKKRGMTQEDITLEEKESVDDSDEMDGSMDDSDDEAGMEMEEEGEDEDKKKKKKKKKRNKTNIMKREGEIKKQKQSNFFKEM